MKSQIDQIEITFKRTDLYQGKIINLHKDEVVLPSGKHSFREIIEHPGGSVVLPINENNEVYFVKQFRYAFNDFLLELPAGKREDKEDPLMTAKRELQEEVGVEAKTWISLGSSLSSPGCFTEEIFLYAAKDFTFIGQNFDEEENIEIITIPFEEALEMVMQQKILDAKTQLAIVKYYLWSTNQDDATNQ